MQVSQPLNGNRARAQLKMHLQPQQTNNRSQPPPAGGKHEQPNKAKRPEEAATSARSLTRPLCHSGTSLLQVPSSRATRLAKGVRILGIVL